MSMVVVSYRRWELLDLLTKVAANDCPSSAVETLLFSSLKLAQSEPAETTESESTTA
jgi:hypothetical protein